jgi:hypothetical protein
MKRTVVGLLAATIVSFVATLGAQDQSQSSATARSGDSRDMTLTGCLSKDVRGHFMLNNAMAGTSSSSSTSPAPGASRSTTSSSSQYASNATWHLSGSSADLEKNIGKKIQVSGTPAPASASAPKPDSESARTTPPAPGAVGTAGAGAERTLNVKTVTMVAATCS